jgi:hypothetical protein
MSNPSPEEPPSGADAGASAGAVPPFPVFLAYQDAAAARQALGLIRSLAEGLDDGVDFDLRLWRLDVLGDSRGQAMATDDLQDAGLLLISAGERQRLPEEVVGWIHACLAAAGCRHLAAVVLWSRPSCAGGDGTHVEVRWASDFTGRLFCAGTGDARTEAEGSRRGGRAPPDVGGGRSR